MPELKEDAAMRFLVVEDNETIRKLYTTLISNKYTGTHTTFAENGKEGLQACKEIEPSLILCDIKMPLMNGIEFHRNLKEAAPHLADRVAFISAGFRNAQLDYMRDNNCRYLEKPFGVNAFHGFIDSILVTEKIKTYTIYEK